jgi:NADH-quinone oxidoreductase subunit M
MIVTLSSVALPGTNGFVGEFLILLGAFRANMLFGILGTTGVVLGAVYMFWMFQRVMFGEVTKEENKKLKDLGKREVLILCSVVFFIVLMGVYPKMFFKKMDASVEGFLKFVKARNAQYLALEGRPPTAALDTLKKSEK